MEKKLQAYCIKPHLAQCTKDICVGCKWFKPMTHSKIENNAMEIAQIYAKDGDDNDWLRIVDIAKAAQRIVLNQIGISIWHLKNEENDETK